MFKLKESEGQDVFNNILMYILIGWVIGALLGFLI